MYKYVLFDLDGTLTDSREGIINSVKYALAKYGILDKDEMKLNNFLGPPLIDSFKSFYDFSDEQADEAVLFYREYFNSKGIFENKVYDGIVELLESLNEIDKILIVATSKPEPFTKKILNHFNLEKYFAFFVGSNLNNSRKDKDEIIDYALKKGNVCDLSQAIMIGDRKHDIIGANKIMIDSIGVLYGYGDFQELKSAGATYIAKNTQEIFNILRMD